MRAFVALLFSFTLFLSEAQEIEVVSGTRDRVSFSHGVSNAQGETALLLKLKKSYKVIVLDAAQKKVGEASFTLTKGLRYSFLGARYNADGFTFYFEAKKKRNDNVIESFTVNKATLAVTFGLANVSLGKSFKRWQHIFSENNLFVIFINRSTRVLKILKSGDNGFLEKDFTLEGRDVNALLDDEQNYKSMYSLPSDGIISSDKSASLADAYPRKKLYTYGNRMVISIEKFGGSYTTSFRVFDYESGEVTKKSFMDAETKSRNRNSFVKDGYIFSVQYDIDKVVMTVRNFETLEVLRVLESDTEEGELLIPETLNREGFLSAWHRSKIKKDEKILNKISKEVGAITVTEEKNRYLITLGAYSEAPPSSSGGGFWDGNGVYTPGFNFYTTGRGATYYYGLIMDKTRLDITGRLKDARVVDVVLRQKEVVGGYDAVIKSKSIVQIGAGYFILYQKIKDRNLYLKEVVY